MFPQATKPFTLTLVFTITLALALTASADANVHHRRDHLQLNRLMKKRQQLVPLVQDPSAGRGGSNLAAGDFPAVIGAGENPNSPATTPTSTPATRPTASAASAAPSNPAASEPAGGAGRPNTATGTSTSASASASRSASASASSSVSESSSASESSSTAEPSTTSESLNLTPVPNAATSAPARVTITSTSKAAASPSSSSAANTGASSSTKRTTFTVLIVIVASVGGAAIIWTIIRKWKFKPSSQFEDRMQPIDWQPTGADNSDIPGHNRRASAASSFHSGTGHADAAPHAGGYNASEYSHGGYAGGAPAQPPLNPIPDHDFTAGSRNGLAPVGGYADLNRGPSPQPQMQDLSQGPMYRPQYEQYAGGVPLHHQTGYGNQDAYDYNGTAARY